MKKKVLITGGTGLIGRRLTEMLLAKNYQVAYLSRKKENIPGVQVFEWDIQKEYLEDGALDDLHCLIHLAGAGVAEKRWTDKRKQEILDSRTKTIGFITKKLKEKNIRPDVFISASGSNYYGGDTGDARKTESMPAGNDFLAHVCVEWEKAANDITEMGVRTVILRTGVVLSKKGGALAPMSLPAKFGFGAPLGSGNQWVSWIHLDDLCRMYIDALENESWHGPYNAIAPNPVTNETLTEEICKALNRPQWLPNVPAFALKLALGEMARVVLGSSYLVNERIGKETTFKYQYEHVRPAVEKELK